MSEPIVGAPGAALIVISGPSGVGKDTILDRLKALHPDANRHYVVTYKSRKPRPLEIPGIHYHFVELQHFEELRARDAFLETAEVYGQWSGSPVDQVRRALADGRDAVLKVDVEGALSVRAKVPDSVLIFVAPLSLTTLNEQLVGRNTETPDQLKKRQDAAAIEMAQQPEFDYVVINRPGEAEATAREIEAIIASEHERHPLRQIRI